ncbi:MAG: hypothetical protein OXF56_04660 [Rhodobacteraceae bacterium]|nr:hypothetical protein [Paracoccaceae bacterium]
MELTRTRFAFVWWWIWLIAVTTASIWMYQELRDIFSPVFKGLFDVGLSDSLPSEIAQRLVIVLAGVLFCWRVVKVVVLQGSPFPFGLRINFPGFNTDKSIRELHQVFIGGPGAIGRASDTDYDFWFGAVFLPHPNSDKLARMRLRFLVLHLCCGWTLTVEASRFSIRKMTHQERADKHVYHAGFRTPEAERASANHLKEIARSLKLIQQQSKG